MTTYFVRDATPADVERLLLLEIEVARLSFGQDAITDPASHRKRIWRGIQSAQDVTVVVVADAEPDTALGWGWLSGRVNALTGASYGNFRTLATFDHPDRGLVGEMVLEEVLSRAVAGGVKELVGKVHVDNTPMRVLYRKFGFEAIHVTMRKRFLDSAQHYCSKELQ